MAKLPRKNLKLFGSTATTGDIRQFASLAAGTPLTTTDPETIQALSRYLAGWSQAVVVNGSGSILPALEDLNALFYLLFYNLCYQFQEGIAEWNSLTTYFINSFAQESGILYISQTNDNLNHQPSLDGGTNWREYLPASGQAFTPYFMQGTASGNSGTYTTIATGYCYIPTPSKSALRTFIAGATSGSGTYDVRALISEFGSYSGGFGNAQALVITASKTITNPVVDYYSTSLAALTLAGSGDWYKVEIQVLRSSPNTWSANCGAALKHN